MSSSDLSFSDAIHNIPARALSYSNSSERFGRQNHRHKPTPIEFDLEDGEVVIYKQLSNELNNGVEKELVRVLMGCDYSADSCSLTPQISDSQISDPPKTKQNLILTHSIMNFHCISVHFSVYNPSNKRGFVSTACISLLQSRQFSCQQAKCVKEELQKCSQLLQKTSEDYWRGTTQTFDVPLSLTELINIASQSETALGGIFNLYSKLLMNSHINTSYDSYFKIAEFLSSLCIGGVSSTQHDLYLNDDKTRDGQITVLSTHTYNGHDAFLDLSKGFKGLYYEGKGLLENFVVHAKSGGQFLTERYWNIVLDYWGLTVRCLAGEQLPTTQDKYVIENFVRKMETEREANKTGRIVPKHPVFSPSLFKYISK
ncbi:UDENN domain-containing protein [Entamoeba marina]